jgi:hypothetical protein
LEQLVQSEVTRKRTKYLGHLPATASFTLAEVDLSDVLPSEALEPFAEELQQRQKRRQNRAQQEAKQHKQELAEAAARAAAAKGPSRAELKAMPRLPANIGQLSEEDALEAAIAKSLGLVGSPEDPILGAASPSGDSSALWESYEPVSENVPETGVSFANIARMGFAATGPSLGPGPSGSGSSPPHTSQAAWGSKASASVPVSMPNNAVGPLPTSAWGGKTGTLANQISAAQIKPAEPSSPSVQGGKKGKKGGKQMVLLNSSQRRY